MGPSPPALRIDRIPAGVAALLVFVIAWLGQYLLILNPGYFSHDELQWAAFAEQRRWFPWLALDAFQYRPLTFNLWLVLSRWLFDTPQAFHALLVAWGSANAALLFLLARRFGAITLPAAAATLVFAFGPYAAYVHGWVGTIGDLIWMSCALLTVLATLRFRAWPIVATLAALLTLVGLLGKEAALAITPLLALAWGLNRSDRRWAVAAVASGVVAVIYLALRLDVLLHAPRGGEQYAVSLANVPMRWIEYQLYLSMATTFEVFNTLGQGVPAWLIAGAALFWAAIVVALWSAGWRCLCLWLAGGLAALAPVLPMGSSSNQYGYGFAAIASLAAALAWRAAPTWARTALALTGVVVVMHGALVMRQMREVGEVQAQFSPALVRILDACDEPSALRMRAEPDADAWIFARLTNDIPSYQGVRIRDRVRIVGPSEHADVAAAADGRLVLLPESRCRIPGG